MKKNLLLAAMAIAASASSVSAEVLTPYTEQFENVTFRPKGWLNGGGSSYAAGTFTVHEEGGHSGGYISVNQYSDYYSSYYNNYNYNDLLITPKVEGEVSLWVRKNGGKPQLTYYVIEDVTNIPTSAQNLVRLEGTEINIVETMTVDDWTKVTIADVPAGTNLGIRAHNLDIDEFTATSADVIYRPSLVASFSNLSEGGTYLAADENNEITFKFSISIENNGDIDFPASEQGFTITLVNAHMDNKVFGTANITEAIPCGTKVEKEFSISGPAEVAPGTSSNNYRIIISHELTGSVEGSLGYFTVIPYAPEPKMMFFEDNDKNQSNYNDVNATDMLTIGAGPSGTSRSFWMWNKGTADLVISAVTVTDGFTCDAEPFTLLPGEKKAMNIAVTGDAGLKTGSVTFTDGRLGDIKYDIQGLVTAEGEYSEGFEGELRPEGMVIGKSWNIKAATDALKTLAGEKYIECTSTYTPDRFFTPMLSFGKDGKLYFMASKTDNVSAKLTVYTSTDRSEWTEVKVIDTAEASEPGSRFNIDKPTGSGYGTYEFRIFSADMPEGNVYVAFEAGGVRIDNICGGQLVPVAHDLYVVSTGIPESASVNTRYIPNITLRNLLSKTETDYAVVLEVDGKEVSRAAETPEIAQGDEKTFDLRFTPHEEGTFNAEFVFVSGEDRVALGSFDFTVEAEKAESTYQVGDVKITSSDPLNTYYQAQCQIIYRADQLGMDKDVKITGFTFTGYNDQEITKHVKVWIQNTDDEGYDPAAVVAADKADMTLVYEGDYTFKTGGNNTAKEYVPMFTVPFDLPFTYDGRSIRIMIDQRDLTEEPVNKHVFFTIDNSVYDYWNDVYDNRVIENRKEYAEDLDDEPSWSIYRTGYPVTYFSVAKDVVTANGNVTDDFGKPVENVLVKYTSDDILYSATTDAAGAYSMNIANVGLTYVLSAEAEGFDTFSQADVTFNAEEPVATRDIELAWTDRIATLSGKVTTSLENGAAVRGAVITLTAGDVTVSTEADENGLYMLTVPEFKSEYTLAVTIEGDPFFSEPYTFASKAETKDIVVAWSSIDAIKAGAEATVRVNGGVITVVAPAGTPVAVYNMTGALVGNAVSDGHALEFGPLAPGIYVAAGVKVVIR